jgi:hypothetical protein
MSEAPAAIETANITATVIIEPILLEPSRI